MISPATAFALLAARNLRLCWAGEDVFERGAVATDQELGGLVVQRPSRLPAVVGRGRGRPRRDAMAPIGPMVPLNPRRILHLVQFLVALPASPPPVEVINSDELAVGDLVTAPGYGLCRVLALTERAIGAEWIPMVFLERERDHLKFTAMRARVLKFEKLAAADHQRPHGIMAGPVPPPWGLRYVSRRHFTEDEDGQRVVLSPPKIFDGLVTYVWSDSPWLTRFWVEPINAESGAVDLGGLGFELLERDMRELEKGSARNGPASSTGNDTGDAEEAAS